MDTFDATPVRTSSSIGQVPFEQASLAEQSAQHPFIFQDASFREPGIRDMTRQQWENLKPLIQEVYIEKNKPFPYLAKILRDKHGFEPTKRQFQRQINKWRFGKNIPRSERRVILQTLARGVGEPILKDRRLKEGKKLKSWKRRYPEEMCGSLMVAAAKRDIEDNRNLREAVPASETELFSDRDQTAINSPSGGSSWMHHLASAPKLGNSAQQAQVHPSKDPWLLDWSKLDVPGSPRLSHLFNALKIESTTHFPSTIPPLSLDVTELDESPCLSGLDIQEVFGGGTKQDNESWRGGGLSRTQRFSISGAPTTAKKLRKSHWQYHHDVFCGYIPSPLAEVYVFPSSPPPKISRKHPLPKLTLWSHHQMQEKELEMKLFKLKKQFPADNPAIVAVMEECAHIFSKLDRYTKVESMNRELLDIYERTLGSNNIKTLKARQKIVKSLRAQGRLFEAEQLNDAMRATISKLFQPHHPLAIRVARTDAWLAEALGRSEDSERIRREILQVTLGSCGPRHYDGIRSLSLLGHTLSQRGSETGEALLRTVLQLLLENFNGDNKASCWAIIDLAAALERNGNYEESYRMVTEAIERYSPSLGRHHKLILYLEERRAWCLLEMGRLVESESVFRYLVSTYSMEKAEYKTGLAFAWCGLANVLSATGNYSEATGWYEKAFQMRFSGRLCHPPTRYAGSKLVQCYIAQGRFGDTLNIYNQMAEELRQKGEDKSYTIVRLESEILRVRRLLEQRSSHTSDFHGINEADISELERVWDYDIRKIGYHG